MAGRSSVGAYPIAAICCLGLILFAIAATIILALIPVYLSTRNLTPNSIYTKQQTLSYSVPLSTSVPTGTLSSSQNAQITSLLLSSQTASSLNNGGLSVSSGQVAASGRRKRQTGLFLLLTIIIFGRDTAALNTVERLLNAYIAQNPGAISALLASILGTTVNPSLVSTTVNPSLVSTTINSALVSSTVGSGRRRRRQAYKPASSLTALDTYKD